MAMLREEGLSPEKAVAEDPPQVHAPLPPPPPPLPLGSPILAIYIWHVLDSGS